MNILDINTLLTEKEKESIKLKNLPPKHLYRDRISNPILGVMGAIPKQFVEKFADKYCFKYLEATPLVTE